MLKALPTRDGKNYLVEGFEQEHLTTEQFQEKFEESPHGKAIRDALQTPLGAEYKPAHKEKAAVRYHNSAYGSLKLLVQREMLLWWRDKYQIKARLLQGM